MFNVNKQAESEARILTVDIRVIVAHTDYSCAVRAPADEDGYLPPSALSPLKTSHRSCRSASSGRRYASGDTWRVDACQSCTCRDGQIHCFSQTCPITPCKRPVLKKGHCCPICTSSKILTTSYFYRIFWEVLKICFIGFFCKMTSRKTRQNWVTASWVCGDRRGKILMNGVSYFEHFCLVARQV